MPQSIFSRFASLMKLPVITSASQSICTRKYPPFLLAPSWMTFRQIASDPSLLNTQSDQVNLSQFGSPIGIVIPAAILSWSLTNSACSVMLASENTNSSASRRSTGAD